MEVENTMLLERVERLEERLSALEGRGAVSKELGVTEAAHYLGLGTSRVYHLVNNRKIAHTKYGKKLLFSTEDLDNYIEQNKIKREKKDEQEK